MPLPALLSKALRYKFKPRGPQYTPNTTTLNTITTGASSATQAVGSTLGWAAGDRVYIGGATKATRIISSITDGVTVVFTATVSTTTGDGVIQTPMTRGTTVTTGAASATQTVGNSNGFTAGDTVFIGGSTQAFATVASITDGVTVVFTASVSTTTADPITRIIPLHGGATLQSEDTISGSKILSFLDDMGVEVAFVTREGNVTGQLVAGPQIVQTMTGNTQPLVLYPGKSFYPVISDSGTRTGSTVPTAGISPGTIIVIQGTDGTKIVSFADNAGNLKLGAATRALALNDTLTLVFDGVNWCELAFIANG